jgi:asparagine synthase (glutamine-hydrolysing)
MCGLAGVIRLGDGNDGIDAEALVKRMCDLQAHRGPDDSGVIALGRVSLGSRRLSIIDLSTAGHMPMCDSTGRWWIAYNGEVYNFAGIREELLKLGHTFRSHTDTEVILHAYMEWNSACLERFVGMFAFALCDTHSGEVVLVRDRYGKKPLYYTQIGDLVMFSSEMKALMIGRNDLRVDKQSLCEWFLYRNVDGLTSRTLVEGIFSVLPGQIVTIGPRRLEMSQYYSPISHVSQSEYERFLAARPEAVVDEIEEILNDAVHLRLVSDVPVGTLLSGGLDSSLVTAIAAKYTKDLTAFHVSVEGFPNLDERRYAEQLTQSLGLPFVPYALKGSEFRRMLPFVTYLSDLPLTHPNSVAYYLISKVAREHDVIVLQSGEGADELFGGYWNYRRRRRLLQLEPLLRKVPERLLSILALFVYANAGMPVSAHRFRELLPPTVDFLDRYARIEWGERCEEAYAFLSRRSDRIIQGAMLADLGDFLTPLLRRLDRTSMGASVETRVPFLDHRLVHKAINLPLAYKVGARADKWVLKQIATRYVPESLVTRKKAGFPLPVDNYVNPLARPEFFADGFCEEFLGLSRRGVSRTMSSWRRWAYGAFGLITLEIWGRIYFMGEPVDRIVELIEQCEHQSAAGIAVTGS